jgi:RNA polymerase-binding transcription factor DksA
MTISKTSDRSTYGHIHQTLDEAERARQAQLNQLPDFTGDLVLEAHRSAIERILAEVRSALTRLSSGSYGTCLGCMTQIPMERLELRPWTAFCVACARA